jgi:hypothetical protein
MRNRENISKLTSRSYIAITLSTVEKRNPMLKYPRQYTSYSALRLFESCPFSFYMRYIAGIKSPQSPKAKLGSLFQEGLNAKYVGQDPKPFIDQMPPKQRGIATLLMLKANTFQEIESLDQPYDIDLGFDIPFRMVPDVLTKSSIIENKYTSGYYNAESIKTEQQALLYYVGMKALFGGSRRVFYQLFNTVKQSVELIEIIPSDQQTDGLFDWIEKQFSGIDQCMRSDIWDTGQHKMCDFSLTCPLMAQYGV